MILPPPALPPLFDLAGTAVFALSGALVAYVGAHPILVTLATMTMGVMGGFALVFVAPWIAFRRAASWRQGLLLATLIGVAAYVVAFLLALACDQPFGPVLALLLIALGLIIA